MRMNILAIGAHPDDIEIGCGGTLIKYGEKGHRIFLLVMTAGDQGATAEVRKREQVDAQAVLGAEQVFWGGYRDTHIPVNQEVINKIEKVIGDVRPSFIFVHHPDDTHQDHRHLAQTTLSATRNLRNVLFYEGPTTWGFQPHVFVDVSRTLDRKIRALEAHRSQVTKTNIEDMSILEIARSAGNFRGVQSRVKYAEGFISQRLFINV